MSKEIESAYNPMERKLRHKNPLKAKKKKMTSTMGVQTASHRQVTKSKARNSKNMMKLFEKRAREYNSDDEDEDISVPYSVVTDSLAFEGEKEHNGNYCKEEGEADLKDRDESIEEEEEVKNKGDSEGEGDEIQPGITKLVEGCRAFRVAFLSIMKKNVSNDIIGPVLSGHKKLIAEKLAEEEEDRKAKKQKHLISEKGHVKPSNLLDSKEKFLISVATKGVVKLFNAVSKAQNAQRGLNPLRSKDAKALGKRRKEAFFTELRKKSVDTSVSDDKGVKTMVWESIDEPTWAPLRDSFMITSSKLKDWDKMPDSVASATDEMPHMDSSDDE